MAKKHPATKASTKRRTEDASKFIRDNFRVDENGHISSNRYATLHIIIREEGKTQQVITAPLSHLVWFLTRGTWPTVGMHIDHIDDNPLNNSPSNLKEITPEENHAKRKGKRTRAYGRTKYGHGIFVWYSKTNKKYCVNRRFPVGEVRKDKDHIAWIGWTDTIEEAEKLIEEYSESLQDLKDYIADMFE